jgi:hypothetical protein
MLENSSFCQNDCSWFHYLFQDASALLSDPNLLAAAAAAAASGAGITLPDGTKLSSEEMLQLLAALTSGALGLDPSASSAPESTSQGSAGLSVDELERKLGVTPTADDTSSSTSAAAPASSDSKPAMPRFNIPLPRQRFALMFRSDMEFVLRSQLMQLQSKNPMNDDFYFQVINARRGTLPLLLLLLLLLLLSIACMGHRC